MIDIKNINYTVLLCVDFEEKVIKRYNELLKRCEIQGGTTEKFGHLYITTRSLRIKKDRTIQYNLILGLGIEDASDISRRIYKEGGEIAVAFFDLKCSVEEMFSVIKSIKEIFPSLICGVALHPEKGEILQPDSLFSSPSEWLYFLSDYTPEQMEQLIAHLISSFILHREKEIALAKNEATREGLQEILNASPELLKKQSQEELADIILKKLRMLTGAVNTFLLILEDKKKKRNKEKNLKYIKGTGNFKNKENYEKYLEKKGKELYNLGIIEKYIDIEGKSEEEVKEIYKKYAQEFLIKTMNNKNIVREEKGVIAPLWLKDKPVGLLFLDREHILTRDTELLGVFAHHVAFAIENRRLQIEIEQKQALEHELNLASRIQNSLLPKKFPKIPKIEIYGLTKSAKEIGGDYFDVLEVQDKYYFSIGDVSGKGVPAGLIMSELRSIIRSFAMIYNSPKEILLNTAQLLLKDIGRSGKFVSILLFQWDGKVLKYSSGGHEHILHYKKDIKKCEAYKSGGIVLGVDYKSFARLLKEKEIDWKPGDTIVLFTDGAIEARNKENKMFKLPNLQKTIEKYHHLPVKDMINAILKEIQDFIGNQTQYDDITLLGIRYIE